MSGAEGEEDVFAELLAKRKQRMTRGATVADRLEEEKRAVRIGQGARAKTGRTEQMNLRVTASFKSAIAEEAKRRNLLPVQVMEEAWALYMTARSNGGIQ